MSSVDLPVHCTVCVRLEYILSRFLGSDHGQKCNSLFQLKSWWLPLKPPVARMKKRKPIIVVVPVLDFDCFGFHDLRFPSFSRTSKSLLLHFLRSQSRVSSETNAQEQARCRRVGYVSCPVCPILRLGVRPKPSREPLHQSQSFQTKKDQGVIHIFSLLIFGPKTIVGSEESNGSRANAALVTFRR